MTQAKTLRVVCPHDCPDTCSLAVTIEDDQVVDVRGSKVNPITHGAVCAKVASAARVLQNPAISRSRNCDVMSGTPGTRPIGG